MKNSVKITSGIYRGREILTPGSGTHPMGARERLALLNTISSYLPEARVLDAFAGSGAIGIEALSRGAAFAIFVEKSPKAARIIKQNLLELGLGDKTEVIIGDVRSYVGENKFDIIVADPPYDNFEIELVAGLTKFLKDDGALALSHPGEVPKLEGLKLIKTASYAGARISIYSR